MGQIELADGQGTLVELRRSPRARRLSLRVSNLDGRVTLTVPNGISEREALDFAREKAGWIARNLERQKARVPVVIGAQVPVEGNAAPGGALEKGGRRGLLPHSRHRAGRANRDTRCGAFEIPGPGPTCRGIRSVRDPDRTFLGKTDA